LRRRFRLRPGFPESDIDICRVAVNVRHSSPGQDKIRIDFLGAVEMPQSLGHPFFRSAIPDLTGQKVFLEGLAPTDRLEAAMIVSLPPGSYTAIVRGVNGTGIGLVEVYALQ
jgi:hypothetical protein